MHGAELLTRYIIEDRIREAREAALARLVRSGRDEAPVAANRGEPVSVGRGGERFFEAPFLPRLRGYPIDPEFARRG